MAYKPDDSSQPLATAPAITSLARAMGEIDTSSILARGRAFTTADATTSLARAMGEIDTSSILARAFTTADATTSLARAMGEIDTSSILARAFTTADAMRLAEADLSAEQEEQVEAWGALKLLLLLQRPDLRDDPAAVQLAAHAAAVVIVSLGLTLMVVAPEIFALATGLLALGQGGRWVKSKSSRLLVPEGTDAVEPD
ncbi:hypothetical protein [Ornithinimicrobium sediminis]|uniref:hypothetical protein n=1 Tax=Ornithinimicrobium sediminis TaxID=2904603 RepID=UPI001E3E86D4|nr:hypothetical protein [Ornithinimicrobium sediminis]MCE0487370.1 hypothetical protein [Ornithinimicrobium sediminis]